jgi:hypothetical protein
MNDQNDSDSNDEDVLFSIEADVALLDVISEQQDCESGESKNVDSQDSASNINVSKLSLSAENEKLTWKIPFIMYH